MTFWEQKKVVVTGGYGFIGSHLVERLLDAGTNVKVADFAPGESSKSNLEAVVREIGADVDQPIPGPG